MKPFHFRLTRFLRLNEAEQRQCAIALVQENNSLGAEQQKLNLRIDQQDQVRQSYAGLVGRQTTVIDWVVADHALSGAKTRVLKQGQAVKKAETQVEKARQILVRKSSEVETLKRLRERKRKDYDVQFRRDEQKQIDEKAVERFAQSRRPSLGQTGKNLPTEAGNPGQSQ